MNCKVLQNEIEEASDPRVLDKRVSAHIAFCTSCQSVLRARVGLDVLLKDLPMVEASSDFDWRLRARLDGVIATAPGFHANFFSRWGTMRLAGAAAVLFLVFVGVIGYGIRLRSNQQISEVVKAEPISIGRSPAYGSLLRDPASRSDASSEVPKRGSTPVSRRVRQLDTLANESKISLVKHQQREIRRTDGLRTVDLAVRAPTVLFGDRGNNGSFIDVADASGRFSVPERNVKVKLREPRGQLRTVSLRSVTFGSQQILEPMGRAASNSGTQGIW